MTCTPLTLAGEVGGASATTTLPKPPPAPSAVATAGAVALSTPAQVCPSFGRRACGGVGVGGGRGMLPWPVWRAARPAPPVSRAGNPGRRALPPAPRPVDLTIPAAGCRIVSGSALPTRPLVPT